MLTAMILRPRSLRRSRGCKFFLSRASLSVYIKTTAEHLLCTTVQSRRELLHRRILRYEPLLASKEDLAQTFATALLFFDFLLTFPDEVQRIWRRRVTGATVIFCLTRYAAVLERVVLLVSVLIPTMEDEVREQNISLFPSTLTVIFYSREYRNQFGQIRSQHLSSSFSCVPILRLDDALTDLNYLMFGSTYPPLSEFNYMS